MNTEYDVVIPDLKINLDDLGITDSTYEEFTDKELRKMIAGTMSTVEEGAIISGEVIAVRDKHVIVDIGYKSEGVISNDEFPNIKEIVPGKKIEVLLVEKENRGGNVHISKSAADEQRAWDVTLKACDDGTRVTGKILRKVKGGLIIDIGIEAFLPASQISLQNIKGIDEYIGQDMEVKVLKINHERQNVVVSRRELLDEERSVQRQDFLSKVKVGDVQKGIVKNITDFGAFVDLMGIDGLLHLTDMKWGRINHPSDIISLNEEIDVMVIGIDYDKERVSLGIKQMIDNPWLDIAERYAVGTLIPGKVVNLLPYGAFMELEEGIEGLIHISEFSWTRKVNHPSEFLKLGDKVEAIVLSVEPYEQKISLGLRQTQENPWETIDERYPIGAKIEGVVRSLTTYGAFVELEDGIDGLIHVSDMSWTRKINHPSEVLKKGEKIETVVLSVKADERKIALGIKQLTEDPWDRIHDHYSDGDVVTGEITNITSFGAFIKLRDDIEGLIHISEVVEGGVKDIKDVLKVGEEATGKIVRIDSVDKKIAVSIKDYVYDKEHENDVVAEESKDDDQKSKARTQRFEEGINITFGDEKKAEENVDQASRLEEDGEQKTEDGEQKTEEVAEEAPNVDQASRLEEDGEQKTEEVAEEAPNVDQASRLEEDGEQKTEEVAEEAPNVDQASRLEEDGEQKTEEVAEEAPNVAQASRLEKAEEEPNVAQASRLGKTEKAPAKEEEKAEKTSSE